MILILQDYTQDWILGFGTRSDVEARGRIWTFWSGTSDDGYLPMTLSHFGVDLLWILEI
jgi:hypothetical protein